MKNLFYYAQRFTNRFRTKSISLIDGTFSANGFESTTDRHNLKTYKDSLYLYIGVNMISKRVAGIPLELYKIKNKRGDVTELLQHPILELLAKPNEYQTQREFMELSVAYYLLAGDAFWYLERGASGEIEAMHSLRPDFMQIILSTDQKDIIAYEYTNIQQMKFAPEDILHFRNIDPTNPLRGVGVVRPASSRIATEKEASKYQENFFKNQGRPDVAVFANRQLSTDDIIEARANWKRVYGSGKGGQAGFFGSDITKLEQLNVTPKEMDFIASQNFLRDDILAALHIPKAMVTSDDVNLANAQTAKVMYLEEAIIPVLNLFIDVINNRLIPNIDISVFFEYENPVPADREMMLKEAAQGVGKWLTQNEVRDMYNLPPMDGADSLQDISAISAARQLDLQAAGKAILRKRPILMLKLSAIEELASTLKPTPVKRQMNSIFTTKDAKQAYAKAFNDNVDKKADGFKEALDAFHKGQIERIIANNKDGFTVTHFMDAPDERRLIQAALLPTYTALYTNAGQDTLTALIHGKKNVDTFFASANLLLQLDQRVRFFANSVTDTTFEVLKNKIVDGIQNGDGTDVIARDLRSYYDNMSVSRANTIARTETSYVISKATNDAYSQSSVVTGKEWITAGDSKVRDEHVMNDGMIVGKDASFPDGESYPGESSINCRCTLAPAV